MKKSLACLDDEDETEVQFLSVSNYHLEDDDDMPVCFSALPIQWGDSESSSGSAANKDGKVFLHGSADNGLRKIFMQVTAWRFDLSYVKPKISLLSKDRRWIRLQKPRKSFVDTVRTILITLHFLHRVKKDPRTTATSLWNTLCKDKELSSYGIKPSQKDLLDHLPLIGEAAKRDAVLAKSKLLLTVIGEKPGNQKLSHEDVKDLAQPGFIVDDNDNDMIDEAKEDSEAEDVCALCDNGGNLLCCDGACRRSFHATKEDGRESNCDSLGFTQKEVDEIQSYYCKNCEYHQHQCFACGKLGSSDKVRGAEVIKCASATCNRFYHPHCVAKSLPQVVKHVAEEDLERNIADGNPFTCPIHYCCVCKELENKMEPELQFAVCRRCPKSYHRKCLPREIAFEDIDDEDIVQRAWEDLLPNNRILIYCLNHDIDDELRTPIRDYIKFPGDKATVQENNTTNKRIKPATKENVILKNNADLDNSSGKSTAKRSKVTGRLSSSKVGSKKSSEKMNSGSHTSIKLKSNEISRCLTGNKKSISKKFKMADCEENMPLIEEKSCAVMNKGSKRTKHDNQVDATVREINTTNKRMKSATKESITLKKNNIDLDNSSGKSTAKGSKVTGELSSSKVGSKKSSEKIISGSNTSSKLKSNEISRRRLTGNKSISKKFKIADCEENRPLIDEKLCAVMNKGSKRIKHDNQVDDVDGETLFVKPIRSELPLFDAYSERSLLDSFKEARSLISLEGVLEKDTFASTHTLSLGKMEGSADAHTIDGDYDDNPAMNHDLLESTGDQEDQASINESQKRSSHHGDFVEESNKGQGSRMSKPGKTSRKKKHKKNDKRGLGLASPAKRGAVNGVPKGVPDHSQPNPIDGRCPVEGFQPKSVMACAHEEDGNNDCGNLKPTSDSVSPLSDGGVTNIEEHHSREEEKCQSESDRRQQVSNSGAQDLVSTESDHLSGRDPNCGYMGYSHEQLNAVTDSSYKMNTPAMERYAPHVDELNHVKMSSVGSEPLTFSSNGTCEHRVPLPGFAPGPHPNAYSLQNSAGWLIE